MLSAEAAFVVPILILLILGIMDSARYLMMRQLLDNAVREGARTAAVSTASATTADIQAVVTNQLSAGTFSDLTVEVYKADPTTGTSTGAWTAAGLGDCIGVSATTTFVPTVPGFGLLRESISLTATCAVYSEAN
jgi:Flp pilus assembly protein TadG